MGRAVCSFGDFDIPHCSPMTRFGQSTNVRVNGRGCGRIGDGVLGCTFVATGSSNVFAGG